VSLASKIKEGLGEAKDLTADMTARVADVAGGAVTEAKELAGDVAAKLPGHTEQAGTPPSPVHLQNLTQQAKDSGDFRHVLATGGHTQVVIMSIPPGGEIGEEVHADTDQILYLVEGSGQVILDGETADFRVGDLVLVTAGTRHNFKTTGDAAMKIITAYSPAHHPEGTVQTTKPES
jgi:mannose-6-phosphate isomerase-like protein (cupin superfamily)